MDFLQLAKKRQSDRSYTDKPIDLQILLKCLETAHLAPSAINLQPWRFIVIEDNETKQKVCRALQVARGENVINSFAQKAPVLVAFCGDTSAKWHKFDVGAAVNYFCLALAEQGIGSCIMGGMYEDQINEILNIPPSFEVEVIVAVGYSEQETREKNRKNVDEFVFYNQFGNKTK